MHKSIYIFTLTALFASALAITGCRADSGAAHAGHTKGTIDNRLADDGGNDDDGATVHDHDVDCTCKDGESIAVAEITSTEGSELKGTAVFVRTDADEVTVVVDLAGLEPGEHAIHIHEMGDCGDHAMAAGGHWNPTKQDHGKWGEGAFHLGDIGNISVDENGVGHLELSTNLWSLSTGAENDVVGHALMVHASPDDFATQPTGNAGARIGCGVIDTP